MDRDRISNLPDELLSRILSFLPTKYAAATSVLSKNMRHVFVHLTTSIDLDDSPISHCLKEPHRIESFPTFKNFVNSVLLQGRHSIECQYLTTFRLRFGGDYNKQLYNYWISHRCGEGCFPDLKHTYLNAWMCFPLTRSVKELDLCIQVRDSGFKVPLEIFTCETLEVLKLDLGGLDFDQVSNLTFFRLPKLRVFYLNSVLLCNDDFITRLVSSCPSLEDLAVELCWWKHADFITISSPSLRRLALDMNLKCDDLKTSEVVLLDTPNLQYFRYFDNLSSRYSITNMNALVIAQIETYKNVDVENYLEASCQSMLSLVKPLYNVQRLSLRNTCTEMLDYGDVKDQLPVFSNLKYLELGYDSCNKWDIVLLEFLKCSPNLETLVFPQGVSYCCCLMDGRLDEDLQRIIESETLCWRTTRAIPSCCRSHLKRIVIEKYCGTERELELVKFLLKITPVLEEMVICQITVPPQIVDKKSLESTLKKLPRGSIIRVQSVG